MKTFFIGVKPWTAKHLNVPIMVSINAMKRYSRLVVNHSALIDSGAFTTVNKFGGYPAGSLLEYARQIKKFANSRILGFVGQDYMCEDFVLAKTGLTIEQHQKLTIVRYKRLRCLVPTDVYIMPVLQGYDPSDYARHVEMYGALLNQGQWVGVGSVCKRNKSPLSVIAVLSAISKARPDLRLHGFGIKKAALKSSTVNSLLFSSDSFAWSFDQRMNRKNADCPTAAMRYAKDIVEAPLQMELPLWH